MKKRWNIGLVLLAIGAIVYGGSKPGPGQRPSRFVMDEYLADAGSYSTNSTVHIAATKLSAQIPDDTPLLAFAALMGTTNWLELLPRRTYADLPADWSLPDATNYDYIVGLDWAPPTPVVTNDILLVNALAAKGSTPPGPTLSAVLPAVALKRTLNGYVADGLVAMWDGVEHGDDPLIWRDISGNGWDLTVTQGSVWETNALYCASYQKFGIASMPNRLIPPNSVEHVEITCFATARASNPLLFYNGNSNLKNSKNIVITAARNGVETSQEKRHSACVLDTGLFRISATWDKLYIDGERITDTTFTRDTWSGGSESFALFGRSNDTNYAVAGRVYSVRIYNRELTADEIRHNYEIDKERFNLP